MYAQEIENLIYPLNHNNIFKGVFSSNNLPSKKNFTIPAAFIINLSPSHEPGSHWVGIYINKKRIGYYFDSYGYLPKIKSIIKKKLYSLHLLAVSSLF